VTTRAVILARGIGSRMKARDSEVALSAEQQAAADAGAKAMMPIAGRPFLDFILSGLADAGLREIGLVVAPDHDAIRDRYERAAAPARVSIGYIVQDEAIGTANAVLAAESWTRGEPFLVMNADNLYPTPVLSRLAALDRPGLPAFDRDDLVTSSNIPRARVQAFALLGVDDDGYLTSIVEKPAGVDIVNAPHPVLVSMNCWAFDRTIFDACRDVGRSARGEFELPEAVMLAVGRGQKFVTFPATGAVLDLSRRADTAEVARRLEGVAVRL
jgi:glucose-1-phosphate thymidylyltransferase